MKKNKNHKKITAKLSSTQKENKPMANHLDKIP